MSLIHSYGLRVPVPYSGCEHRGCASRHVISGGHIDEAPATVLGKQQGGKQHKPLGCCREWERACEEQTWTGRVWECWVLLTCLCCWRNCKWTHALNRMTKADSGELTSVCAHFRSSGLMFQSFILFTG